MQMEHKEKKEMLVLEVLKVQLEQELKVKQEKKEMLVLEVLKEQMVLKEQLEKKEQ